MLVLSLAIILSLGAVIALSIALLALSERRRQFAARRLLPPGRAMGMLEQVFDEMHHMGAFVSGVAARITGPLDPARLRRAADVLQAKHPLLSVHVERDDGLFRAEGTLPIPLRLVAQEGEASWKREFLREIELPIPYGPCPLIRLTWVYEAGVQGTLIIAANHAVFDGMSAIAMLRDILAECSGSVPLRTALLAPFARPSIDDGLRGLALPARPKDVKPVLLPSPEKTTAEERRAGFDVARVDASTMVALLARCRNEQTTIHGVVSAAALFAAGVLFGADREVSLSSNISVRKELAPPVGDDAVGCFISGVTTTHLVNESGDLWELSRAVRGAVTQAISERRHLSVLVGDFTWLHRLGLRHLLPRANDGRLNAINVSNSGKFDLERNYGPFRLDELYFISSQAVLGSTLQVAVVTLGDELFVVFSWARPLLSDEQAATAKGAFQKALAMAARGEPVTIADLR